MEDDCRVEYDLTIYRGQTYTKDAWFTEDDVPMDFAGCTVKSEIRPVENSPMLTASFDIDMEPQEGHIQLCLEPETTARLKKGTYRWDMKITDADGDVMYWIYGKVLVKGRVTV